MHVAADLLNRCRVPPVVHDDRVRPETTGEHVSLPLEPAVVPNGEALQHALHEAGQPALRTVDDEMKVCGHHTVRMNFDAKLLRSIRELEEEDPVFSIVDEDVLSIDTAIGEMEPSVLLR